MPIYEFYCMDCGHRFEELLKISENNGKMECPRCRGTNTRKAVSAFCTGGGSSSDSSSSSHGCKFG
ncbi:FmdB family zinc ribbon protein [Thermoanaerobacterium sp. DL9XJH110]|uniref:FmdB family zinc ribbon protein n=1 Tax=Thermoanaerobacterium sp. DL9XJH110 TaxID=3386643 RepID=UPI003BB5126D